MTTQRCTGAGKGRPTAGTLIVGDCLEVMMAWPDDSVDLVFGSPPYCDARDYGIGFKLNAEEWVDWMLERTAEAVRICRGPVIWVVNSVVRHGEYQPAVEGLVWEWHQRRGSGKRPVIWSKNSPPNRQDWFRNDHEHVVAFKSPGPLPFFDWESVASPPKYKSGGAFRQRGKDGKRQRGSEYPQSKLARPGDVIRIPVGGGLMGHDLAHETEAPMPLALAEHFVKTCCPPRGLVLDPFLGSGTTCHAAQLHGRRYAGIDLRESQIELTRRRLQDVA